MEKKFRINRRLEPGQYLLEDLVADIRTYEILPEIFADGSEIDKAMAQTKVFITDTPHEIYVDNNDGSIIIGLAHLRRMSDEFLYLDIIHELCHVKQHLQGRDLYDRSKAYVDRETEIEAYAITVQEARRMGLNDHDISDYLRVSWITEEEHRRLARRLAVAERVPYDAG